MKSNFLIIAAVCLIVAFRIVASDSGVNSNSIFESETISPTQFHQFLGNIKAEKLNKAREYAGIESADRALLTNQNEYDVLFYDLSLTIDLENEYVDSASLKMVGRVLVNDFETVELNFIDSIVDPVWDPEAVNLTVDSVFDDEGLLQFSHENNKITVTLSRPYSQDEQFNFTVSYHGHPWATYAYMFGQLKSHGTGLAFGTQNALNDPNSSIPVAYTDCEPYDSRRWWPCKDTPSDKPDSMGIHVTVNEPYYCAANGKLIEIEELQAVPPKRTFHYKVSHPIVTYAVALSITEFDIWTDWYYYGDNDSMPIVNHIYPYFYDEALETWDITAQTLEIYSNAFCEYPFVDEKYGHAQYENYGMEHQTNTAMPATPWAHSTEYLIIHEMAHQWFGDMITCKTWHDIWLNEGFGTYCEAIYYEGIRGANGYRNHMASLEYLGNRSVYIYDTTNANDVFNIVVYHKGAWVLHMLRGILGDETFFALMHAYSDGEYKYNGLTTEEFITFCNNFTGLNLDEFFNDWVYGIMYPVYAHTFCVEPDLSDGNYWICYYFRQTQTYGPEVFDMPVDLRFFSNDIVIKDTTIYNDNRAEMIVVKTSDVPDSIVIDPDNWILNESFKISWTYHLLPLPLDTADQFTGYLDTILCRGGSGHNTFQIIDGNLPSGLSLGSQSGIISGGPGESGDFAFTVSVDDDLSTYHDALEYNLHVRSGGIGWPGDANGDNEIDILDIVFLINFKYKSGPAPAVPVKADANNDCSIDILDIVYLINYKYKAGPFPIMGCAEL